MRHRKKGRKLNRTASHKKALMRNLANQLFEHKEIRTTTAKAKEARSTVERLITYAKKGDLHHRRLAFSFLRQKATIKMLFDEIGPSYSDRQGGYTRIIKLGKRLGDGAAMSILQLVGFEALGDTARAEKKKRARKKKEMAAAAKEDVKTEETKKPDQQAEKDTVEKPVAETEEKQAAPVVNDQEQTVEKEKVKKVKAEPGPSADENASEPEDKIEEQTEIKDQEDSHPEKEKS